jgi:site-specific recombinase XerD
VSSTNPRRPYYPFGLILAVPPNRAFRAFRAFLGPDSGPDAVTAASVRAYRDRLEQQGRSPRSPSSSPRELAGALGLDGVPEVRGAKVARGEPRALSTDDYARLLHMPDLRTTAGKRDLALLHLLGTAGLRRAETCC